MTNSDVMRCLFLRNCSPDPVCPRDPSLMKEITKLEKEMRIVSQVCQRWCVRVDECKTNIYIRKRLGKSSWKGLCYSHLLKHT